MSAERRPGPYPSAARGGWKTLDWLLSLALIALAGGGYAALLQGRFYGDGANLTTSHLSGESIENYNVLFLLFCRVVGQLSPGLDVIRVPHVAAAVAGALAVGLAYPVLRFFEASRPRALFGCALMALAPAVLFFSTTSEVHTLHLLAVTLVATVTLYAPWQRPALALACVALVFPLLHWSHVTAATLGPGWVFLVQAARARRAEPFRWRTLLFVIGPILLAMLLVAMALANLYRMGSLTADTSEMVYWFKDAFRPPLAHRMPVHGWLLPLFVLVPLAPLGFARSRPRGWDEAALALLIVPALVFFLVYGVAERGAYMLGSILFWSVLAARALPGLTVLGPLFVLLQGSLGLYMLREYDQGFDMQERVEMVRSSLGEQGCLISGGSWSIDVKHSLPEVTEISIWLVLRRYRGTDASHADVARSIAGELEGLIATQPVAVDLSYRANSGDAVVQELLPAMDALEDELQRRFDTELHPHPYWPMLRLRPKSDSPGG